jgi:hypothetical protein
MPRIETPWIWWTLAFAVANPSSTTAMEVPGTADAVVVAAATYENSLVAKGADFGTTLLSFVQNFKMSM